MCGYDQIHMCEKLIDIFNQLRIFIIIYVAYNTALFKKTLKSSRHNTLFITDILIDKTYKIFIYELQRFPFNFSLVRQNNFSGGSTYVCEGCHYEIYNMIVLYTTYMFFLRSQLLEYVNCQFHNNY